MNGGASTTEGTYIQMRAQPATSEVRRPAAQLVAYGGSQAGSMREGAHPGRIAAYPAQDDSRPSRIPDAVWSHAGSSSPFRDTTGRATRRPAGVAESSRASRGWWDRNADDYQVEHGTFPAPRAGALRALG
ncbi:hypothetical protein GCM10010307_14670 [Streptomyces vastus]|uniref:Uncharacterized protein n=1 Tax=Streptomyces vastus TaxID=285451 RepID=A0ABN3QHK0_9ACTN